MVQSLLGMPTFATRHQAHAWCNQQIGTWRAYGFADADIDEGGWRRYGSAKPMPSISCTAGSPRTGARMASRMP
jgi:hypothetical protein